MGKEGLILIVDDDLMEIEILRELFEAQYEVVVAENGKVALEQINRYAEQLSLILLDIYMPLLDGYSVLETVVSNKHWSHIPVVISTAESSAESDQRLYESGAYAVIHKPINTDVVKKQIDNIVERMKSHNVFIKDYMLQETLIHKTANTFLCAYHFLERSVNIGEDYQEFFGDYFPAIFAAEPFLVKELVLPKNLAEAEQFFDIWHKDKLYDEIELRLKIDAVHYEWFKIAIMIQCNEGGHRENAVFMFTNTEYEVEAKDKLNFMAVNDPLTHIPNRRTFSDDVRGVLNRYPEEKFAMITLDICQFRMINKLYGYNEGDSVLRYLATKLQEMIESFEKGVYCRMSSDIFYACISEQENLDEFVEDMQKKLNDYPLKFDFKIYFGVYPITDQAESVEHMIEHASYARLEAKKSPVMNVQYYDDKMKKKEFFEAIVVSEKEQALESGQFEVYYQPKCNLHTGRVIGSEALIRWNNPKEGFLSPGIFVPIFEQNGFITELDYYVCESVCKKLRQWLDEGLDPVPVSINISRCDLYDAELYNRIFDIVERYQIPHNLIEFEITESAFILERALLSNFTKELRDKVFCVLIDDFGSGYSSLNSLKNIEVDVLKIDIAFLPVSSSETKSPIILEAVINMAKRLGLETIAEGVETREQLELLKKLGCENIQGYYFYRPMPVADYEKILREQG